jgi:hypothetical protein
MRSYESNSGNVACAEIGASLGIAPRPARKKSLRALVYFAGIKFLQCLQKEQIHPAALLAELGGLR